MSFKWNAAVSSGASRRDAVPSFALWHLRWETGETNKPQIYLFLGLGLPPRLCRLPQYSTPLTNTTPPVEEAPPQANERTEGPVSTRPPLTQPTNHNSERLIGDGITDQLVSLESSSEPMESLFCPSCFTAEYQGLQPAASRVSRLKFCINGRTRLDSSCRDCVCSSCNVFM